MSGDFVYSPIIVNPSSTEGNGMAKKDEKPRVDCYGAGLPGEDFPNGSPTAVITHLGLKMVLRFAPDDLAGEGDIQEIRLLSDTGPLDTSSLKLLPSGAMYFQAARAAMALLGTGEEKKTQEEKWDAWYTALESFRNAAGPGRALNDAFYRLLGKQREALIAEGEPHPVKALSLIHRVKISTASKWLTEARRRGYIKEAN